MYCFYFSLGEYCSPSRTAAAGRPGGEGARGAETAPQRTPPLRAAHGAPLRAALIYIVLRRLQMPQIPSYLAILFQCLVLRIVSHETMSGLSCRFNNADCRMSRHSTAKAQPLQCNSEPVIRGQKCAEALSLTLTSRHMITVQNTGHNPGHATWQKSEGRAQAP
jgi:hypothetical protein